MEKIDLTEAGLTNNETKVYETLILHGVLSSTECSSKSGVPYGRVYSVLGGLIEKGLVKIIPGKTKKFAPTSPDSLLDLLKKKEEEINKIKERIKELKKFYEQNEKNVIEIAYGDKGFWKLVNSMSKPKKEEYNIRYNYEKRNWEIQEIKKLIKKGIKIFDLVRLISENERDIKKLKKINTNVKILENNGVVISIVDKNEVLIGLIKSNTTLLIRDRPFTEIMKKMFEETYKNAEEIKQK